MGEDPAASVTAAIAAAPMAQSHITRQARRLYLGNIPFGTTEVTNPISALYIY